MSDRSPSTPEPSASAPRPSPDDVKTRVLLAAFHSARGRSDRVEATRLWRLIVGAEWNRVAGIARAYRHASLDGGRIPATDLEEIASDVFMRLHEKVDSLKGRSVGELRAYVRAATGFACLDYMERHVNDRKRRAGSLDAAPESSGRAAGERALAELAEYLAADTDAALNARETIHPALALVEPDKRMVIIMGLRGATNEEIQAELGISRDAVYQRRSRAHRELRDAIRELAEEDDDA